MKKTLLVVTLLVLALGTLSVGVVAAQGQNPPIGQLGFGLMHESMEDAMAEALGLTVAEFNARHDAGETFYQIALAEGFAPEELPGLMEEARAIALDAAVESGVISQDLADWMKSHSAGHGGMFGSYNGYQMHEAGPNSGFGYGGMHGDNGYDGYRMHEGGSGPGAGFGRGGMRGMGGQY